MNSLNNIISVDTLWIYIKWIIIHKLLLPNNFFLEASLMPLFNPKQNTQMQFIREFVVVRYKLIVKVHIRKQHLSISWNIYISAYKPPISIQVIPSVKSTSRQTIASSASFPHTAALSHDPVTDQDGISQAAEKPSICNSFPPRSHPQTGTLAINQCK